MIANHIAAVVMFATTALGCAPKMPLQATYVPADCPPAAVHLTPPLNPGKRIGSHETTLIGAGPKKSSTPPPGAELIDINTASEMELTALPGVGPALAKRIVAYRQKRRFRRISDIRRVRGIGPAKYAHIKAQITVGKKK